ncbi:MAG TPA: carbohydrate porin [Candidatus Binatia bacterium]|jgi:porin
MTRAYLVTVFTVATMLGMWDPVRADEQAPAAAPAPYSAGFFERSTLTGDWGGVRNDLAEKGVKFDLSLTQVGQGVVSGGKNGTWEYGGRGNLTTNIDTQKLGLWPGGFFTLEVEGNYADSVNGKTGALMPVNSNQLFPVPTGDNLNIPQLSFAQFVCPYAGVLLGKLDTTSADANEFAHGKGDRQFFNMAFGLNPSAATVPYSPLGAGVIVLPTGDPDRAILNAMVVQAQASASTSGFENLSAEKLVTSGEGRVRTDFFGLTGHQLVGGFYSNKTFAELDQRLRFVLTNRFASKEGSWTVYYNFDQYLYETDDQGHGVGVFARFGASDGNPNLLHYFYSAGVGGKGVIPSRPNDQFGLGYYYVDVTSPTLQGPLQTRSFLRDEWGFEAYYNVAITPWLLLTPDIQVIGPSQKQQITGLRSRTNIDTAAVLGFRLQVVL